MLTCLVNAIVCGAHMIFPLPHKPTLTDNNKWVSCFPDWFTDGMQTTVFGNGVPYQNVRATARHLGTRTPFDIRHQKGGYGYPPPPPTSRPCSGFRFELWHLLFYPYVERHTIVFLCYDVCPAALPDGHLSIFLEKNHIELYSQAFQLVFENYHDYKHHWSPTFLCHFNGLCKVTK